MLDVVAELRVKERARVGTGHQHDFVDAEVTTVEQLKQRCIDLGQLLGQLGAHRVEVHEAGQHEIDHVEGGLHLGDALVDERRRHLEQRGRVREVVGARQAVVQRGPRRHPG